MYGLTTLSLAAMLHFAGLASAASGPNFEKILDASITLDLSSQSSVPVPGGIKLGIPVSKVDVSGQLNATCSGYSWTTRYDPPSGHYEDVEVRLHGKTSDGVPFNVIEGGTGKETMTTMRRIRFEIGAPYEWLQTEFLVAHIVSPLPDYKIEVYKYVH